MFTANTSSDLANGINAVAQCFQSIRSNNASGTGNSSSINHDDTISQPRQDNATIGGIPMSASTGVGSGVLLSHQNAPSVCVVSSSMDFFGAPESSYYSPPPPPTTTTTITTATTNSTSFVNPASVPTTHIVNINNEGQVHTTASTVSNKKKSIDIDTSASTSNIKKIKHNSKIKDVVPRDRSLERAAVAAVLASLDSANKKTDVKPTTSLSNQVETTTTSMKSDTTRGTSPSRLPKKKLHDVSRAVLGTSSLGGIHTPDKSKVYKPDMNPQFRGTTTSYIPESTPNVNISNTVPITGNFPHVVKKESIPVVQPPPIVDDNNSKQLNEQVNISNNNIINDVEPYVPSFRSKHDPNWKPAIISSPGQYDVLLGRGKSNKNHPGNKRFQDFIQANRDRYFNALTNTAKRGITLEILQVIRQKGKFLRRGTQGWVEVPTAEIQQKVAHALQYRRRCVIKERQTSPERSPNEAAVSSMNHHTIPIGFNNNVSNIDPRLLSLAISSSMAASHPRLSSNPMVDQNKRPDEYYMNRVGDENRRKHCDSDNEDDDDDDDHDMDDDDDHDDHNNNQYDNQRIDQVHQQQQYASAMISEFLRNNQSVVTGGVPSLNNTNTNSNNNNNTAQISTPTITNSNYPLNALNNVVGSSYPQQINPYQRPPPNSDNLDASGLHSLAEVISRMCHPDGVDSNNNNNNNNNAMNRVGY